MAEVSAEEVFCKVKPEVSVVPKIQLVKQPDPIYTEDDSDNDSDFEPIYKINKDEHSDLKSL